MYCLRVDVFSLLDRLKEFGSCFAGTFTSGDARGSKRQSLKADLRFVRCGSPHGVEEELHSLEESFVGTDEDKRRLDLMHAKRWDFQPVRFATSYGGQQSIEQDGLLVPVLPQIGQQPEGRPADVVFPAAFLPTPECVGQTLSLVPCEVPKVGTFPPTPGVRRGEGVDPCPMALCHPHARQRFRQQASSRADAG